MTQACDEGTLQAIRRLIAQEDFGGPATYSLLASRNPEIRLLLNAGIVAGLRLAAELRNQEEEP